MGKPKQAVEDPAIAEATTTAVDSDDATAVVNILLITFVFSIDATSGTWLWLLDTLST